MADEISAGQSIADAYRKLPAGVSAAPEVSAGQSIADAYRTQTVDQSPPSAPSFLDRVRSVIEQDPNKIYGSPAPEGHYLDPAYGGIPGQVAASMFSPFARDPKTGETNLTLPSAIRSPLLGALDVLQGRVQVDPNNPLYGIRPTPESSALMGVLANPLRFGSREPIPASLAAREAPLTPAFKAAPISPELAQAATVPTDAGVSPVGVGTSPVGPTTAIPNATPRGPLVVPQPPVPAAPELTAADILGARSATPATSALDPTPTAAPPSRVTPIVTQKQAEAEADRIIQHFAGSQTPIIDTTPLASGAQPTLSQSIQGGGNAGLAALERGVRDVPQQTQYFTARETGNTTLRNKAVGDVIGDSRATDVTEAALNARTRPQEAAIFDPARTSPVDPSAAIARLDEIIQSGKGQRDAIKEPLLHLRAKLIDKDGNMQTDPAQLRGVDQSIGDQISPLASGKPNDGRAAAHELMDVRSVLRDTMEPGAPGYKDFLASQAAERSAIDGQRFLQARNITDRMGNVNLGTLDSTIKAAESQQRLPGARLADGVTDEQLTRLKQLRADYQNDVKQRLGTSIGSPTVQKLGVSGAMGAMGHPLLAGALGTGGAWAAGVANPLMGAALGVASYAMKQQSAKGQRMVMDALRHKLLNPEHARSAFKP